MNDRLPRKLAAILYADVAGYSRLTGQDEDSTHRTLSEYLDLISARVTAHNGHVMHFAGDAVLARFDAIIDALSSAFEFQREIADRNEALDEDRRVCFRVGVNLGDVIEDRGDIYGDGVNIAARLESLARPGGICISEAVRSAIQGKFEIDCRAMGEKALKNIEQPVKAYAAITGAEQGSTTPANEAGQPQSGMDFNLPDRPSIAIIPFKSLGANADQDYLADGIRLGIQASLVQLSGMFLINAPVLNAYKATNLTALEVGNELDVAYVLEGAVQQAGNRVRATVQLIQVTTGKAIWAEKYDRTIDEIFELQDEITRGVIISINDKLLGRDGSRLWASKLQNPESHTWFYRGLSHLYEGNKEDNALARQMFEKLYELEPHSVIGPSNIAITYWCDGFFKWTDSPEKAYALAREWAEKSVEYEDNNGLGHAVLGYLELLGGEHEKALATSNKSVELRGSCPLANVVRGLVLNYSGDPTSAVRDIREALHLQRVYPPWMINSLAVAYRDSGDIDLSISAANEALRLKPGTSETQLVLCSAYAFGDDPGEARSVANSILGREPSFSLAQYADSIPYKQDDTRNKIIAALRESGLPD